MRRVLVSHYYNAGSQRGASILLAIVIMGAAGLILAVGATTLGLEISEQGYGARAGGEAFIATEGCLEEAMERIRMNINYGVGAGPFSFTLPNGSCILEITDLGSNRRRVDARGTVAEYTKHLQSDLTLSGNVITVDQWQERSD